MAAMLFFLAGIGAGVVLLGVLLLLPVASFRRPSGPAYTTTCDDGEFRPLTGRSHYARPPLRVVRLRLHEPAASDNAAG